MVSVFNTLLGSTADTCSASVYEAFLEELRFLRDSGLSDPEVDPRPSDCKLWSLRSCSPSWRTGRFPCSLSFSSCSSLTRWSTSVVQVSLHARCVHRQMPWWTSLWPRSDLFQLSASTAGMMGRFFRALHTGAGPGSCPQGHGPHDQVHLVRSYRQRHVRYTLVRTTTTTTTTQSVSVKCSLCRCLLWTSCGWPWLIARAVASGVPGVAGSDGCAPC